MKKLFYIKSIVFITIVACLIFFMSYTARHIEQEAVKAEEGYVDLTDFDFDEKLAYLNTGFDYYREILYDPYDFEAGNLSKPVITNEKKGRFNPGDYGTYRMIVRLNKGVTYGISSYSAMYSQRLFINKSEYEQIGKVGVTKEETVAKTKHYTYYFTPTEDVTEIVIQFSNNVHSDYGGIVALYLGSQDLIQARDAVMQQRTNIIAGCLITAFLFFVGMFIYFGNKSFLWFSMISLSIAVRTLSVKEKVIMLLIPEMPWEMAIGIEYISLILLVFSFLMYVRNMFPNYVNKIVMSVFGALSTLYAFVVILSCPAIYTKYLLVYQIVSALFSLYIIASLFYYLIIKKEKCLPEHLLVFMSLSFFVLMAILEIRIHRISGFKFATGLTEVGMIVMIFVNMIALSMQFSRTKSELDKAQKNELQMQETNQLLDRMMRLKSDFLANISHEMRTPLTVMSSFAGLTTMQIKNDKTNDKTIENLNTIVSEAKRLSDLIEQIKHISAGKQRQFSITNSDIVAMLKRTADFCKPICDKNNNTIKIENRADKILLNINEEGIFQTLLNLVVNANRHTSEGVIKLSASEDKKEAGFIKITVSDDGKGIDDKLLPHLFERGVSGSGDSGLGLAISREIIEEHGGRIWAESKKGYGTDVSFILPYDKSER